MLARRPRLRGAFEPDLEPHTLSPHLPTPASPHWFHHHLLFIWTSFTAKADINGYTQIPHQGGKRQILIMLRPKGGGGLRSSQGEKQNTHGLSRARRRSRREATQMLPSTRAPSWMETDHQGWSLPRCCRLPQGTLFSERVATPLPGSTRWAHHANHNREGVFLTSVCRRGG